MIDTKEKFVKLWRNGSLGNRLRTWDTLEEIEGYDGLLSIREKCPSGFTYYNVSQHVAPFIAAGRDVYFGEMAPDTCLRLQGEFWERTLTFSCEKVPMKHVANWNHIDGSAALVILAGYMSPASWEDFNELRELYPGHVIEFGCYGCDLGHLPHRNTVIWEVRTY